MCVGAALGLSTTAGSGLFGLSAASAFNIGLGLTAANAFAGRAAAQQRADQTYNQALPLWHQVFLLSPLLWELYPR